MKAKLLSAGLIVALCATAALADRPRGDKGKKSKDGGDTVQVVTVQALATTQVLAAPSTDPAGPDRGKKREKGGDRRR